MPQARANIRGEAPAWHAVGVDRVLEALGSDVTRGLGSAEAAERLARYGPNALEDVPPPGLAARVLRQLSSPLVFLLFVAAAADAALGRPGETGVILGVVAVNTAIGVAHERRAERSLRALRRLTEPEARIVRDGCERVVPSRDVVPGDVLVLSVGDALPADARLVRAAALQAAEAPLTGESVPTVKRIDPVAADAGVPDRTSMVYAGTHVTSGRGRAVVVATGPSTEIGKIAALTAAAPAARTPLEGRIAQLSRRIGVAAAGLFGLVCGVGYLRGLPFDEVLTVAISQVVSMVPEGLPVAMTIALAVGVHRMARRGAIVRRLGAVETLGATSVICTDKTGTLTRGEMLVAAVHLPGGRALEVSGTGYAPEGGFSEDGRPGDPSRDPALASLLEAAALCNDAQLSPPDREDPRWRAVGDPTEAALLALAAKGGVVLAALRARRPRRAELPFDPDAKLMATQHACPAGSVVFVKGAPEEVLGLCLPDTAHAGIRAAADAMAARALRVLALASVDGAVLDGAQRFAGLRGRATFLGLVGELDPPRREAAAAVERCLEAGIRPVMVSGDHRATACAVAEHLGMRRAGDAVLEGREVDSLDDAGLDGAISRTSVFARSQPAQKLRIVEAWQRHGDVVAMTGDGVNDAPALARADVGVAMGRSGTDVAKEAADIVVTDDDFATIVAAVEEGRLVHRNVQKLLLFLFATSIDEVVILLAALFLGLPLPLAAVQILWINVVTEGFLTVNLVLDPPDGDEMRRPPVPARTPLVTREMLGRMAVMIPGSVAATFGWFAVRIGAGAPVDLVRTETFTLLAVCQWWNALSCRSSRASALSPSLMGNPWLAAGLAVSATLQLVVIYWAPLGALFHTVPLAPATLLRIALVATLPLVLEEARKVVARLRDRRAARHSR